MTEEELLKKAGKEVGGWVGGWVDLYSFLVRWVYSSSLFEPPRLPPPTHPPYLQGFTYVAEDDVKKHYDVLMGLDLVLEEKEIEVKYQ